MMERRRRFRLAQGTTAGLAGGVEACAGWGQNRSPAPTVGSSLPGLGLIFVVDLGGGSGAVDHFLHSGEGVAVGL